MKDLLDPNVSVRYIIKSQTKHGMFKDALYFSGDEWEKLEQVDLDKAIQSRIDNWVAFHDNPPAKVEPKEEDLQAEIDYLSERMSAATAAIVAVQSKPK